VGGSLPSQNSSPPDCRTLIAAGQQPIPGENCSEPLRIQDWVVTDGATLHAVLVDLKLPSEAYGGIVPFMTCDFASGGRYESLVSATEHLDVKEWIGEEQDQIARLVFGGCGPVKDPVCNLGADQRGYVTPGLNLVFVGKNCCLETWEPGTWLVYAIYPVLDDHVYDWDGASIKLDLVRESVSDAKTSPPPMGLPDYDLDCSDIGGKAVVEVFPSLSAYQDSIAKSDSGYDSPDLGGIPQP